MGKEITTISPEGLEVANCYLQFGNIRAVVESLGVPENAVVVPGSVPSKTGNCMLNAAIIVKYADAQTREKTSINALLRDDSLQHDHASITAN